MEYEIRFKPSAQKELEKLPGKDKKRITTTIVSLRKDPFAGKKLDGEYKGYYSIRVWPYRIIYTIVKQELIIIIVRIGHRQGVY